MVQFHPLSVFRYESKLEREVEKKDRGRERVRSEMHDIQNRRSFQGKFSDILFCFQSLLDAKEILDSRSISDL